MELNKPLIILGAGGHAGVLFDIVKLRYGVLKGIVDPKLRKQDGNNWNELNVIEESEIYSYAPSDILLINAVGSLPGSTVRQRLYAKWKTHGYSFATLIHPSAIIGSNVIIQEGCQIMAGAIIQTGAMIGANSIINTKASIDHDSVIGQNCHAAPGATICGACNIGENVHIGTGASIIQQCSIGSNSVIGAGTTITNDIPENMVALGAKSQPYKPL